MKQTFVAFLRGINVGGRFVKMERLKELFALAGVPAVRTHIQSGNVFFECTPAKRAALARKIERTLSESLGYDVPVFVRSIPELESVFARDPFKRVKVAADLRLCVIFISTPLPADFKLPHHAANGTFDLLSATDTEVFAVVGVRNGSPGNPVAFLEKKFKLKATARFFSTTAKILDAARTP